MPVKGLAVLNEFNNINYVVLLIEPFFFGKLQYAAVKFSALKNEISSFFARSWSVGTALILDTQRMLTIQNQTASKNKAKTDKIDIFVWLVTILPLFPKSIAQTIEKKLL